MAEVGYLSCTNKGCYEPGYHKLDVESNQVICDECGQEVEVSPYMKKMLKSNGQVFRKVKTAKEVVCPHCKAADVPVLLDYGKDVCEVVCCHCGSVNEHLTKYFVAPMKMNPGVEKIEVKIVEGAAGNGFVVQADGSPLPWNTPSTTKLEPEEVVDSNNDALLFDEPLGEFEEESIDELLEPAAVPQDEPVVRRAGPASAAEMLKRAGVKNAMFEEEEEPVVRRIIKKPSQVPNNRPKSAAEMLNRAGFDLLDSAEEDF